MAFSAFWLRRDLRFFDNKALHKALNSNQKTLVVFIFDDNILSKLPVDDHRVTLIHRQLAVLNEELKKYNSSILVKKGNPVMVWKEIISDYPIDHLFYNADFEPYTINRDNEVTNLFKSKGKNVSYFNDHLIFAPGQILKPDGKPYTVYTPYSKRWLDKVSTVEIPEYECALENEKLALLNLDFPTLQDIGFVPSNMEIPGFDFGNIKNYKLLRDYPSLNHTTFISTYLRFGILSIRQILKQFQHETDFVKELIWREFFIQILYYFPHVESGSFKKEYNRVKWLNREEDFSAWCEGRTGYPLVDAGMRELNATGLMHNRVRMITASFLTKHLLVDWRLGEEYFAEKLFDFELSSNNGNWQWAAGTGCDAAPYFRVFSPAAQQEKFDKEREYIRKWVPEIGTAAYPKPIVDHGMARARAMETYRKALKE